MMFHTCIAVLLIHWRKRIQLMNTPACRHRAWGYWSRNSLDCTDKFVMGVRWDHNPVNLSSSNTCVFHLWSYPINFTLHEDSCWYWLMEKGELDVRWRETVLCTGRGWSSLQGWGHGKTMVVPWLINDCRAGLSTSFFFVSREKQPSDNGIENQMTGYSAVLLFSVSLSLPFSLLPFW